MVTPSAALKQPLRPQAPEALALPTIPPTTALPCTAVTLPRKAQPLRVSPGAPSTTVAYWSPTMPPMRRKAPSAVLPDIAASTSVPEMLPLSNFPAAPPSRSVAASCVRAKLPRTVQPVTVSAPAGEYQSGDLIPIQITADEYIQRNDNAAITINGESYLLSDLHASSSGKFLSLLYEVQPFDTQSLIISLSSDCGITDIFGNPVNEVNGVTLPDITLVAPLVKNAPTGLTASAFDDSGITFTVTADDDYDMIGELL